MLLWTKLFSHYARESYHPLQYLFNLVRPAKTLLYPGWVPRTKLFSQSTYQPLFQKKYSNLLYRLEYGFEEI